MSPTFHIYVSELGNIFMTEIAAAINAAVTDLGYETVFPSPGLPEGALGRINLVVAPHEYFLLQANSSEAELFRAAEQSVCIGVEQPGTPWFELSCSYASLGQHVLDISTFAVDELRRRGVPATHLQFGYHKSWDHWGGNLNKSRQTDLLFLGASTSRRERALGAAGPMLWEFTSDIRLFEFNQPMTVPSGHFVAGNDKWDLLSAARVLLNIHRSDVPYFEWIRVLEAVVNGAAVVTEVSTDYGPLVPGAHFLATPIDCIGAQTASLLWDEDLRSELSIAAYDFVRRHLDLASALEPICEQLIEEVVKDRRTTAQNGRPLLQSIPREPAASHPVLEAALDVERQARVRIKDLLDSETDLVQSLEALQAQIVHGDPNHVVESLTPSWAEFAPEVSVILTCYNYSHFVTQAIESVLSATNIRCELIVVDDHSQDDSVKTIAHLMSQVPWFPIKLLARSANAGLGAARDLGIRHSRSDRVFMLDADNTIFPTCLSKLSQALDLDPDAAFAYGIICRFGSPGLLSQFPWQVSRLAKDNYIDAMSLLRKKIWEEVGGYDASLRGWEDYELWLRIADHGYRGQFIPEFVGSYRVHGESLLQTVNVDVTALLQDFRKRYPFLPWTTQ